MSAAIREALGRLALARATSEGLAADLRATRAAFDAANADLIASVKAAADAVAAADTAVRALAEAHYADTKEAKPLKGVEVKLRTSLVYDDVAAFAWAQQTKMALIPESLDRKAFEKIARATSLPFVTVVEEPTVTVATDLSAYLLPETPAPAAATPGEVPF